MYTYTRLLQYYRVYILYMFVREIVHPLIKSKCDVDVEGRRLWTLTASED